MLVLDLIRSYLTLGVDPPDPPIDPPDPAQVDPPDDDDLPPLDADEDPDPEKVDPDPVAELKAEREARAKAEREAAEYKAAAERAREVQSRPPPGPSDEQKRFEQEEAILRDPAATEQQRYWVEANRTLRASNRMAQDAQFMARETADLADFERIKTATPGLIKRYGEAVEKKLKEIRADGKNLDRRLVLKMLIGDDYVEGRVKSKTKEAAKKVERGAPASPRGDVRSGGGAKTNLEKLESRLDGVRL